MQKLLLTVLLMGGLLNLGFSQTKKPAPNKIKIEAEGLFLSTTEDDLENVLALANKLDRLPNNKTCTVELTGIAIKDGQEIKITVKGEKPTCIEAANEAKQTLLQAKSAIVDKKE